MLMHIFLETQSNAQSRSRARCNKKKSIKTDASSRNRISAIPKGPQQPVLGSQMYSLHGTENVIVVLFTSS